MTPSRESSPSTFSSRTWKWMLIAGIGILLTAVYFFLFIEEPEMELDEFLGEVIKKYGDRRTVGRECGFHERVSGNICYIFVDNIAITKEISMVIRRFEQESNPLLSMSMLMLKIPDRRTLSNLDTSKWQTDFNKISLYNADAICNLLKSGAIKVDEEAKIILLGLGVGGTHAYLVDTFPKLDVTSVELEEKMIESSQTWMQLNRLKRGNIVHGDAIEYLKNISEKGEKVKAVYLDVSTFDLKSDWAAPPKHFWADDVLETISNVLDDDGVFVSNIVYLNQDDITMTVEFEVRREMAANYFKECIIHSLDALYANYLLYCIKEKTVEIPIEEAKKLLMERGWVTQEQTNAFMIHMLEN